MAEEKKKHTALKIIGGVTATAASAYAGFSYVIFRHEFDLKRSMIHKSTNLIHSDTEKEEWFMHSEKKDCFMNSYDGLKLHALALENHPESNTWIILVHGTASYFKNMIDYMYEADHRGFNILAIDQRGCGTSEGKYTSLGWNEHYDLMNWINYLISTHKDAKIALFGLNTGGATVINAVGDYLPNQVKCAVEDGAYSSIKDIINYTTRHLAHVEAKPFLPAVDVLVKQILHFSLHDISQKQQLREAEVPMLFIHGSTDTTVPTSMVFDNYYACASEKELYVVEGKGYNETYTSPEYFNRLFSYIEKHIHEQTLGYKIERIYTFKQLKQ